MTASTVNLFLGDFLEIMPTLAPASVDMVLTDIPYGVVNRSSGGLRNLDKGRADIIEFPLCALISAVVRVCSGSTYIFCGTEQVSELRRLLAAAGMTTRLGIWEKTNPSPMNGDKLWLSSVECCVFARRSRAVFTEHCKSSVWRHATQHGKLHPTQKPLGLFARLVAASTNPGDVVLDNCMGSGTAGVAAVNAGRSFIGIEKSPEYFAIAERRISDAQIQQQQKGATP